MQTLTPSAPRGLGHCGLTALLLFASVPAHPAETDMVRVPIREVDTVFANPGQGWMSQTPLSGVRVSGERELVFGGYPWTVRSGHGGPGPNAWATDNVWLDAATNLHLKIAHREGKWSCAEVTLQQRLGFGRYRFQTVGRIDRLDDNVVLGLFNYPTREVGPDATHEIDIEFARWGEAGNPLGNFTVWPVERGLKPVSKAFPVALTGDEATHGFHWGHRQIVFQSANGHREDQREAISTWTYRPSEPARFISRQPMPVHLNLWLFQGRPPKDGQEVEVIIRGFKHTPDGP